MDASSTPATIDGCTACKLRSQDAFCHLPAETLHTLDQISYPISYPEHAVLFSEGQACQAVFLLCSGRVKLSASAQDGKTLMLRAATSGQVLGLSSVLAGSEYTVTAETLSPAVVRTFKRGDFIHFLHHHESAGLHALDTLCQEYSTAFESLRSLAWFSTATARVAQLLLQLCSQDGALPNQMRAKLVLTQEQIAQMTATSRETVTRFFSELRRNRVISIRGSDLVIRDRAALERMTC